MARILVIDDDALVLESVKIALEFNGHGVVTAHDGVDGMKLVHAETFDLVITDLIMPRMDGMETLLEIKRSPSAPKVMVISGGGRVSSGHYLETADALGADDVLAKPFSTSELMARVEGVLA